MKKGIITILLVIILLTTFGCKKEDKTLPMNISQDEWSESKKFVELSTGIKMAYVEMGKVDGPVIILQHGTTDNSRAWSLAAPFFTEAGYHVYLPDLRGMGKSDAPNGIYTPITYATDLGAFFDAMNIEKATLVGHSLGSFVMQTFALMFPERVEKLVLVSSIPMKNYQSASGLYIYQNLIETLPEGGHQSDKFMDFWYNSTLQEPEYSDVFDTFIAYMKKEAQVLTKDAWENIMLGFLCNDYTDLYNAIDLNIPTLILHGSEDEMTKSMYQPELCELFKVDENSYREYTGIGHNIQFEMPKKCATEILYWLKNGKLQNE